MEVDDRREPARNGKKIAVPTLGFSANACGDAFQMMASALGTDRDGVIENGECWVARRSGPCIQDRNNSRTCFRQCCGSAISIIIIGRDYNAFARKHPKASRISARGLGQHDAGPVIVRKGHGPFYATSCENHVARADMPKLLGDTMRRHLAWFGEPLAQSQEVVIPIS